LSVPGRALFFRKHNGRSRKVERVEAAGIHFLMALRGISEKFPRLSFHGGQGGMREGIALVLVVAGDDAMHGKQAHAVTWNTAGLPESEGGETGLSGAICRGVGK